MASVQTAADLRFDPPGPGTWLLDNVHWPRPATRYYTELHPENFQRGVREFLAHYGLLLDSLEFAYVNGFAYRTAHPVPEERLPERFRRAEEAFEQKAWRDQLREWDERFKPESIRTHRSLQSIDPASLSDEELAEHLARCRDRHGEMIYQHMRFTGAAMLPIGDFLGQAGEWTGLPHADLLGLLRGTAPVSAGASDELDRLIAAIRRDSAAQELLQSDGDAGAVLAELRSRGGETGSAVAAYLDLVGYRLLDGFDISNPYALELPESLVTMIRAVIEEGAGGAPDEEPADRTADARAKVPAEHRSTFDDLLEEARLTYRLRDERGVLSDVWAAGITRRVVLAAGERLVRAGRIQEPAHLVDAGYEEMRSLVSGADGPSAEELAERFLRRTARTARDAPPVLGPPPGPPPDPSGLPPAAARADRAIGIVMQALFGSSEAEHEERVLRGLPASPGVYEGPARRVTDPAEFDLIAKGDVLVTTSTSEAFNILLPLLGAMVTDSGGLLSHAAIVAREYGIPGVVGTREGTVLIQDGARVRVDGSAGEVRLLQ